MKSHTTHLSRKYKESNKEGYGLKITKNDETALQPPMDDYNIDINDLFKIPSEESFFELINSSINKNSYESQETNQNDNFIQETVTEKLNDLSEPSLAKGLSLNSPKTLEQWWEYCIKKKFDVILLTETRLKEKGVKFTFLEQKLTTKEENAPYYEYF
ncbi:hypothetical protein Glove_123g9 [Diversispora epigaea]|uniref:Uncharacterized protein n=1 Tax=Diversispora epigaea TaxID=1348612 RepID=A0A397J586_9GLOM|nr:hypothetical protein Glove_123g9 [Diversispora epigaea]